jgi:hypothetical protein
MSGEPAPPSPPGSSLQTKRLVEGMRQPSRTRIHLVLRGGALRVSRLQPPPLGDVPPTPQENRGARTNTGGGGARSCLRMSR